MDMIITLNGNQLLVQTLIDYGFMNDKISGSVDYYVKETSDLLATVPAVAGTNFTNFILTNVGSMKNEGVEVNLNLGLLIQAPLK